MLLKIILGAGIIITVIGMLTVLADAFAQRFLWGLGILLIPILYPLYCMFYWRSDRARNRLLLTVVGLMLVS